MLTILCGRSSCGKDTLVKILKQCGLVPLVSMTTRPMREGEEEGREYYFISREDFLAKVDAGKMLEYREYNTLEGGVSDTWYYGNEYRELDDSRDYITILDLDGATAFKKAYGDRCLVLYVKADAGRRTEWAKARGSFDEEKWECRMRADDRDFSFEKVRAVCDHELINDEDILTLLGNFIRVYKAEKLRREKGWRVEEGG